MLLGNHAKESYHLVPADSGFSLQPPASPDSIRYRYSYDCSRSLRFIIKFGIIIIIILVGKLEKILKIPKKY